MTVISYIPITVPTSNFLVCWIIINRAKSCRSSRSLMTLSPTRTLVFFIQVLIVLYFTSFIGSHIVNFDPCWRRYFTNVSCNKPKIEDARFRHKAELPLTIALPLTIHQLERNESLVTFVSKLHLGVNIDYIRSFYDRTHTAVVERMSKTGGFYFPEFVVRGKPLMFAIDNIDFTEDTPFDQNSTHGTVVVIFQEYAEGHSYHVQRHRYYHRVSFTWRYSTQVVVSIHVQLKQVYIFTGVSAADIHEPFTFIYKRNWASLDLVHGHIKYEIWSCCRSRVWPSIIQREE